MTHNDPKELLKLKKGRNIGRFLPFSTKYKVYKPSLNKILRNKWQNLHNDGHLFSIFPNPPFSAFRNHKTLKAILSYKRRQFNATPKQLTLHSDKAEDFKFLKFNHPSCKNK